MEKSDQKAVQIVKDLINACGGMENWNHTRYLAWYNLGGKRRIIWDKKNGDIRVENMITLVLMNLNTKKGRAWQYGEEITEPDRLQRALDFAYESWQNDSYAVFLPFMLLNKGVILKYLEEGKVNDRPVDIIRVTFNNVGPNPNAEYHLHIDKGSKLLVQWDYYMDVGDEQPRFSLPWLNYKKYGNLLLSNDRGVKKHPEIAVFDKLPASVFTSPEPVDLHELALKDSL